MGLAFGKKFSEDEKLAVRMHAYMLTIFFHCCTALSTARSIQIKDRRAGRHEGGHPVTHGSVNYHGFVNFIDRFLSGKKLLTNHRTEDEVLQRLASAFSAETNQRDDETHM